MTFYNKNINCGKERRLNNSAPAADRRDENLSDRIIKFTEVLKAKEKTYKIPLRFLVSLDDDDDDDDDELFLWYSWPTKGV